MSVGLPNILELITRPEDYIMDYPLYRWYRGIVEDVDDPENRGRVRVRVESVWKNTPKSLEDEQERVVKERLPWAEVMLTGAGDKCGLFYVPPVGTAVVVVFDKGHEEYPLVVGGWFGVSKDDNKTEIPIAARGGDQTGETADDLKGLDTGVNTAGGGTMDEPANPYGAEYPKNTVLRFATGHLIEFDETAGAERINIAHKSGTWAEFHPDGSLVFGIQGKRYTVIEEDDGEHVKGNQDVVVGGDATFISNKYTHDVDSDYEQTILGKSTVDVSGASDHTAANVTLEGSTTVDVKGTNTVVEGTATLELKAPLLQLGGAPFGNVVTTLTHPVDYITGIPIIGVPTVQAG